MGGGGAGLGGGLSVRSREHTATSKATTSFTTETFFGSTGCQLGVKRGNTSRMGGVR